ncbi:hypothetical protein [Halalkalibacter sp. APA_J-10(15)]|uniref:hypothetical protein n=1 Tax=unclassified Halalkalibacter TaxID=2893063 RepID=UPI001FF3453B|nr:hypothetical protein [Halalkalibacter sp. APA_J-10(15)]MCK0473755.1 hypothetical protein [Halalkalibacter sp. APA_J-10(15)]
MLADEVKSWLFIEFSVPEGVELEESDVVEILDSLKLKYKFLISQVIVFDSNNKPSIDKVDKLKLMIAQIVLAKYKKSDDESDYDEDSLNFLIYESQEILFSFNIVGEDISDEDFINYLVRIQDGEVINYDKESEFLANVDYEVKHYSPIPLFHNIRCSNIAIFKLRTLSLGFAIIGYMKINSEFRVTIKAFKYDMLKYIIDNLHKYEWIQNVKWENNINWNWLMSRSVPSGYRIAEEHITSNELMKSFLKITKANALEGKMSFVLERLLNKGYLNEKEYIENISSDREINKFLSTYHRLISNNFPEKGIWIDPSLGLIFDEKNREDPKRIIENNSFEKIYAPTYHLLHYIRMFWHQEFVEEVVKKVKEEFNIEHSNYKIINIKTDAQFDLKRDGDPISSSRDIDILIRIKDNRKNSEYIVAIEAKRNADEFGNVKKDIEKKITQRYARIFKAFIMIAYFNKNDSVTRQDDVKWGHDETPLKRPLFLCANTNFQSLVSDLKDTITMLSEMTNEYE